jgi:hypothetical protein
MSQRHLQALCIACWVVCSPPGMAQNAYKCGDGYSQSPCPGGVAIDADSRSPAQKAQADAATARAAQTARAMEQARLKQEAAALAANTPTVKSTVKDAPKSPPQARKKSRQPEYFTAREPGSKKPARTNGKAVKDKSSPATTGPLKP